MAVAACMATAMQSSNAQRNMHMLTKLHKGHEPMLAKGRCCGQGSFCRYKFSPAITGSHMPSVEDARMMNTAAMCRLWAVTGSVQLSSPPAAHESTVGAGAAAAGARAPVISAICMGHPKSCHHSSPRAAVLCLWHLLCCQDDRMYCLEPSSLTSMTERRLLEAWPPFMPKMHCQL